MLTPKELKEIRERTEIQTRDLLPNSFKKDVLALLDDIAERKKIHVEEQRRSADRLRIAVEALDEIAKVGVGHGTDK